MLETYFAISPKMKIFDQIDSRSLVRADILYHYSASRGKLSYETLLRVQTQLELNLAESQLKLRDFSVEGLNPFRFKIFAGFLPGASSLKPTKRGIKP